MNTDYEYTCNYITAILQPMKLNWHQTSLAIHTDHNIPYIAVSMATMLHLWGAMYDDKFN